MYILLYNFSYFQTRFPFLCWSRINYIILHYTMSSRRDIYRCVGITIYIVIDVLTNSTRFMHYQFCVLYSNMWHWLHRAFKRIPLCNGKRPNIMFFYYEIYQTNCSRNISYIEKKKFIFYFCSFRNVCLFPPSIDCLHINANLTI